MIIVLKVQECDATNDAMKNKSWLQNKITVKII